jgi:conjugative transfer region lipoprotein (TIGR03751 family)
MQTHTISLFALAWISACLAGCASTKESILPQDGPTMQAIYAAHFDGIDAADPMALRRSLGARPVDEALPAEGYLREARTEIDTVFPRLPNPTLVLYIYPHLAGDENVPVPGYATTFPMYERNEYALPGEVSVGEHERRP